MMRRQRAAHARIWIFLALLIAALFVAALTARERVHAEQDRIARGPE